MFERPLGGTELMHEELMRRLSDEEKEEYSIFNYPEQADFNKKMIYWNQLSYDQDAVKFLSYKENIDRIEKIVFVSHWQAEQFRKIFRIPGSKTHVIKNACIGVGIRKHRQEKKIRLCYTSTPWRGLDILLNAWEILSPDPETHELHIFSSCKIYGPEYSAEEQKYQYLYDWCERLPGVQYRGSVPNQQLRSETESFDILAYPCSFEETSCIAAIDALSAGLRVVCSSIGALPETTEGWARIYSYEEDRIVHSKKFAKILREEIEKVRSGSLDRMLSDQANAYRRWHWDERIEEWKSLLKTI
jgi:glycosyltransferase involved in cell wall biosynthesis